MIDLPSSLALTQLDRDRQATKRMAKLLGRKVERMTASPFAFLRGSAPLFYQLLDKHPELRAEGPGEGWVVGDAHIENFGAFRSAKTDAPVFDVNDFDECGHGPIWLDILRLTTSVVLAARELGKQGRETMLLSSDLFDAWQSNVCGKKRLPPEPHEVKRLLKAVGDRKMRDLLHGRIVEKHHKAKFLRGTRYYDLPKPLASAVPAAFEKYLASVDEHERPKDSHAEIIDVAWRVAGTGSLGKVRVAILASGKDAPWIFDLKEQGAPPTKRIAKQGKSPAERVVLGARAMLDDPPHALGTTNLTGLSMLGRRLSPMDDKLDLAHVPSEDLPALVRYLGALLGAAHRRGERIKARPWSSNERGRLLDAAMALAGIHEAAYLAYCTESDSE
jgi:uncharacterized protein (DUF2252 family)